jgi:hypothetical protein
MKISPQETRIGLKSDFAQVTFAAGSCQAGHSAQRAAGIFRQGLLV